MKFDAIAPDPWRLAITAPNILWPTQRITLSIAREPSFRDSAQCGYALKETIERDRFLFLAAYQWCLRSTIEIESIL
jgi:hypothetical protein